MAGRASARPRLPRHLWLFFPILVFAAFLTQIRIVPQIHNNVGLFEIVGALVIASFFLRVSVRQVRSHAVIRIVLLIVAAAAVSQLNLPWTHTLQGLIQLAILVFLLLFLVTLYNLTLRYRISPVYFLRFVLLSILIVGPWIIAQGVQSGGDIQAAGPFRNRAHMASYMLTGFWLVLILALWPRLSRRLRYTSYAALGLCLYAVAISGRRSVYLALIFGLVGLAIAFVAAHRGKRLRMVLTAAFVIGFLGLLYALGSELSPQTAFFQRRVGMIGERLSQVLAEESFFSMQRQGALVAFREHPILGIGWGGFAKSSYSVTGHEMHSTPLRFLAELGLVGLGLYAALIAQLLGRSLRLFLRMRRSPYGASFLALALGLWTMSISYLYNRHITERTFWLLLVVFLTLEIFAADWQRWLRSVRRAKAEEARPPATARPAAAAMARLETGTG